MEYKGVAPRWEGQGGVQGCGSEVGGTGWRLIHGCSHHSTYVPTVVQGEEGGPLLTRCGQAICYNSSDVLKHRLWDHVFP